MGFCLWKFTNINGIFYGNLLTSMGLFYGNLLTSMGLFYGNLLTLMFFFWKFTNMNWSFL